MPLYCWHPISWVITAFVLISMCHLLCLQDMESSEIGAILRHPAAGPAVRSLVDSFPRLHLEAQLHPITRCEPALHPRHGRLLQCTGSVAFMHIGHASPNLPTCLPLQCLWPCILGRSVLRVQLKITPEFTWHDRAHGGALRWHLWVEDSDSEAIYHTEVPACACSLCSTVTGVRTQPEVMMLHPLEGHDQFFDKEPVKSFMVGRCGR
jgi:Sec63 Brl domain